MSYQILETPDSIIIKGKGPELDHFKLLLRGNSIPASVHDELIEPFGSKMVYPAREETRLTLDRAAFILAYQALSDVRDARKLNGLEDRLLLLIGRKILEAKDMTEVKGYPEHDKPKKGEHDKRLGNQI